MAVYLGNLMPREEVYEEEGIVERTVIPETPIRVEYSLTKKGRALAAPIQAITDWAHKWIEEEPPAAARTRRKRTA